MIIGNKDKDGSKIIKDYNINLNLVLKHIKRINSYVEKMNFEEFEKETFPQDGVTYNFRVIGEILKKIPDEIKNKFETKEYKEIIKFIETLLKYWEIDFKKEWNLIQNELIEFEKQIKEVIE
jgi:uncharacterized protein with HEPN domain